MKQYKENKIFIKRENKKRTGIKTKEHRLTLRLNLVALLEVK